MQILCEALMAAVVTQYLIHLSFVSALVCRVTHMYASRMSSCSQTSAWAIHLQNANSSPCCLMPC